MSDFFESYGEGLHRAARRRVRRGRALRAAGAAAVAVLALAVAVPAVVRDDPEREVAAPTATATPTAEGEGWTRYAPLTGCGPADPYESDLRTPPELLRRYRILRDGRPARPKDMRLPEVARVFPRGARELVVEGRRYVVVPVLLWTSTDCERAGARPGLCVQPDDGAPNCAHRKPVVRLGEDFVQVVPDDESAINVTRDLRP